MKTILNDGLPNDVLIVEDDPIIALDFEDKILSFGVSAVRSADTVARALGMIADRAGHADSPSVPGTARHRPEPRPR